MITTGPTTVYCSQCNARPGQRCFSRNGKVLKGVHKVRRDKHRLKATRG